MSNATQKNQQSDTHSSSQKSERSVIRLVMGILAILMSLLVMLQSCAVAGLGALVGSDEAGGAVGVLLVAPMVLAAGIVDIATCGSREKAGSIASVVLYALAALCGFASAGSYTDMNIWATAALIFAIVDVVVLFVRRSRSQGNAG